MTEWVPWNGGECPIPDAKAGEYKITLRNGDDNIPEWGAKDADWSHEGAYCEFDIIAYRLIEKEQSDLDWLEGEISKMITHEKSYPTAIQKAWAKGSNHGLECALERIRERRKIKS